MQATIYRPTLLRALLPRETLLSQAALVVGGSAVVALSAQIRFGLPFTPVPVTGQTFAVLFAGALLGGRLGAASMTIYWTAGAFGLPVFNGWGGGWAMATGPTGGYIVGFIAAAFVVGWFTERGWDRGPRIILPLLAGNALIYALGLPWLARFVGPHEVLHAGLWPFIPGDLLKLVAATIALPGGWTVVRKLRAI